MADSSTNASLAEIEELRDDIELNTGLLASLGDGSDSESEDTKAVVKRTLKKLRKRLNILTSMSADPKEVSEDAGLARLEDPPTMDSNGRSKNLMPPPAFDLVNRKRQRDEFDGHDDIRGSKSRRQSPSPVSGSPAPSAQSTDSIDFDDDLKAILGYSQEEEKEHSAYMKSLGDRKRQEAADEAFARALQSQLNDEPPVVSTSASSQSQTILQPNGSLSRPKYQSPQKPKDQAKPKFGYPSFPSTSGGFGASAPSTPSDTSLEEITARDFPFQSQRAYGMNGSSSFGHPGFAPYSTMSSMPGAFPGPGASVYNTTPYNSTTSAQGFPTNHITASTGVSGMVRAALGSMLDPVNLDNYESLLPQYADPAKTQEELKDLLKHIRPDEELTPEQRDYVPEGLKVKLMPHQALGVGWMGKMENASNKGGILADDMGLGKTLQAIALMLGRQAPQDDRRPNLVVAPVALLQQWSREFQKFVLPTHRMSVLILHGQTRTTNYNAIRNYDVILTTYGTLASELKKRIIWEDRLRRDPEARPSKKEECAILGDKSKFHRVILDEAQNIKNRATKAALAGCRINSTFRWCLTGTPMQNNVEEMYSLVKFCRIRPYCDWNKFSSDFSRPLKSRYEAGKDRAMDKLQALLRAILLRRTKKSEIDGKPILQLPEKTTVEDRAIFSKDELDFYKALESKAQIQFNKYLRNGSIGRNYSNALVLLLRLRQACCHPHLVSKSNDFLLGNALANLEPTDMIANAKELSDEVIERLQSMEAFECPVCMDADENPVIFQCGHALCQDCLSKLCDQAISSEEGSKASCPHCRAKIDANKITNLISFLRVHCPNREGVEPLEANANDDSTDSESSDEDESDEDGDLDNFVVADDDGIEYDSDASHDKHLQKLRASTKSNSSSRASSRKPRKSKGKGKAKFKPKAKSLAELRKEGLRNKSAKRRYLKKLAKDWQPSTKIEKTMKILEEIEMRGLGEKTIIFSNFTSFLDLVEVPLSRHPNLGVYARYDGSMTPAERNDAVLSFTDNKHCKVILVSLKAGNSGLNLTAANHVIMMDPFWNPFVEYQAADRAYRIGQLREVTIHRLLIGEDELSGGPAQGEERPDFTVEDRILKLQQKKEALVNTALDERAGARLGRLGVRELGYLFGVNGLDR
jgi:SNF2 family DNA or RNA helicase